HLSYVTILLIGDVIPRDLVLVHLAISVESNYLKKTLNAKRNLYYTFNWDKQDKYQQKIYGVSTVKVSVGYEYMGCSEIFWTVSTGRMVAYSWNPMDFHKWRVNVLHAYDPSGGILHRGDGSMFLFRDQPPHITTYIGDGSIRKHECKRCVETISECRLIAPVDIVEGTDGSLYMADYNFVRKISPENNSVTNVLQLNITDVSYKYYLAVNPLDGSVFVSNYKNYRILRIKNTSSFSDAAKNFEVYVGTGEPCIPGDKELCGDNGPAIQAKLFFPKGIAINKDGVLYIADGKNVRMVNGEGIITTVVGTPKLPGPFIPFPCSGVSMASDVMLQWPTSLSINHLDES
ncbi:hypothetical protein HELRODRAFT_122962, partial [Helobdella robusta]|uniref:SMP-30/Gluconolactonase/LRE-like region domain-containing protein n=1 Tax=Helobdella robusta TaxID=6412 RepID=T1EGW4_HELRO